MFSKVNRCIYRFFGVIALPILINNNANTKLEDSMGMTALDCLDGKAPDGVPNNIKDIVVDNYPYRDENIKNKPAFSVDQYIELKTLFNY